MSYKKVKTIFIFDKPKCIYMKPKGTREYVKSKGEMVLLSAYIKKAEKIAAKKALASKMAKKSKASRSPMKRMRLKRRSIYGGFFNEDGEGDGVGGEEKEMEEQLQQAMSGGQGFEELVSKENVEKLLNEHELKKNELATINASTVEHMWLKDLDTLKAAYSHFLETHIKSEDKSKKSKKNK